MLKLQVLTFYPNPATDLLTISDTSEISVIEIYDISGKNVLSQDLNVKKTDLNISKLKTGMYILKTNSNGKTESHSLLNSLKNKI